MTVSVERQAERYNVYGGNGVRKGLGYRVSTPGGWLAKAGYAAYEIQFFLNDLANLAERLHLIAVGIDIASSEFFGLNRMQNLAATEDGLGELKKLHLRIFASENSQQAWSTTFGWTETSLAFAKANVERIAELNAAILRERLSSRAVAMGVNTDPSFVNKVLKGKMPAPEELLA